METEVLEAWVRQNSGSHNREGLERMAALLENALARLPGKLERLVPPPVDTLELSGFRSGPLLRFTFHPRAPAQVLFSGHMDTVYGADHPFQTITRMSESHLRGPGIADMKGGLFILMAGLERFLQEPEAEGLGGTVLISSDEEIGSPASTGLLREAARRHHLGLVFESALPGGELVNARKGTGLFRLRARGRAAHTGRDFEKGLNAVVALARVMTQCHSLNTSLEETIVNVTRISGGEALNVVPDKAECWLNVRVGSVAQAKAFEEALAKVIGEAKARHPNLHLEAAGEFLRPPKTESTAEVRLHAFWNAAEKAAGYPPSGKRATGGGSDGNLLAGEGLPVLDGIGIKGNHIHSEEEFAILDSIPEQVDKLTAFLLHFARHPEELPTPNPLAP